MDNKFLESLWEINEKKLTDAIGLFSTEKQWKRYEDYKIIYDENEFPYIVSTDDNKYISYNPFDFYPQILLDFINLSSEINTIIELNNKIYTSIKLDELDENYERTGYINDIPVYTSKVVSVPTEREKEELSKIANTLLPFISEYGLFSLHDDDLLLGSYGSGGFIINGYSEMYLLNDEFYIGDPVDVLKDLIRHYYLTYKSLSEYKNSNYKPDDILFKDITWGKYLSEILAIDKIGLTVNFNSKVPQLAWKFNSLIQALNIMLIYNITVDGNHIESCQLDTCKKPFIPTKKNQIYCSSKCGGVVRQRRYVDNKNKEVK